MAAVCCRSPGVDSAILMLPQSLACVTVLTVTHALTLRQACVFVGRGSLAARVTASRDAVVPSGLICGSGRGVVSWPSRVLGILALVFRV